MPEIDATVESLRQRALALHRAGELDAALLAYDEALAAASDDEARELVTINKADVLIALERSGAEVQALPAILMRRRNPHHTFLAAYQLAFKHRSADEVQRATFYNEIALTTAEEAGNVFWQVSALNERGVLFEMDSRFREAVDCFERALALLSAIEGPDEKKISRTSILQNLAFNRLQIGEVNEALAIIHGILDEIQSPAAKADSYIDLAYGYTELQQYDRAMEYGLLGLELAQEERQVKNAHYLIGESAYKAGLNDVAEKHFDELAARYPQFKHLKPLLFAIDLRSMINFNR